MLAALEKSKQNTAHLAPILAAAKTASDPACPQPTIITSYVDVIDTS
jgi:hypothetical protein